MRCKGAVAAVATRENRLQLLHGGLKRVQERGVRHQLADELRISAPWLGACACSELGIVVRSLDSRACIHWCTQEEPGKNVCMPSIGMIEALALLVG
jgi:hypothetical protein